MIGMIHFLFSWILCGKGCYRSIHSRESWLSSKLCCPRVEKVGVSALLLLLFAADIGSAEEEALVLCIHPTL
jgi:hypothetical protein